MFFGQDNIGIKVTNENKNKINDNHKKKNIHIIKLIKLNYKEKK